MTNRRMLQNTKTTTRPQVDRENMIRFASGVPQRNPSAIQTLTHISHLHELWSGIAFIHRVPSHSWQSWLTEKCDAKSGTEDMPQFIKASICFSKSLVPGVLPAAAQTLQRAKPDVLNDTNLTLAGLRAAPDTWRCLCMNVFEESDEYLSLLGMPVIPNASEWCFPFSVWMEFDSFVHFMSRAAALIIPDSVWVRANVFSFIKSEEELFISLAVFLHLWQRFLVFVSYEAILLLLKASSNSVTTYYYEALRV